MWLKYIAIIFLFYFFAILQNSFFAHLDLFGAIPNLVFILLFVLVFFTKQTKGHPGYFEVAGYAVLAGLFLDIFSYTYFGVSIVSLLLISFIMKKIQALLQEKTDNNFPYIYFLPLFLISFLFYDFILNIFVDNFNFLSMFSGFNQVLLAEIFYNILIASIMFFVYKKLFISDGNNRIRLFKK